MFSKLGSLSIMLFAVSTLLFSCKQEASQTASGKQKPQQSALHTAKVAQSQSGTQTVGYEAENGDFIPISEDNLLDYYKSMDLLSDGASAASIDVQQGTNDDGTTFDYVSLHTVDGDTHVKISTLVSPHNGDLARMALGVTTCTCKSTNCGGAWDCNSSLTNGLCSCSGCSGENGTCEKTSTTSSMAAVRSFFIGIGVI